MKKLIYLLLSAQLIGCATTHVSQNFSMLAFDDKGDTKNTRSVGNVEGKDCIWYVFGYPTGDQPTVRSAIYNAVYQKSDSLIPGQKSEPQGPPLKLIKNMSVSSSGFHAWALGRYCVVTTGVGLQ